jgi:hypothetical protein
MIYDPGRDQREETKKANVACHRDRDFIKKHQASRMV